MAAIASAVYICGMRLSQKSSITADDLRAIRVGLGMTQTALAEALGVGHRTVVGWERGEVQIPRLAELALETVKRRAP